MEHHLQSLKTQDLSLFLFPLANIEMCSLEARKVIQDWWHTWGLLCTMLCQDWWHTWDLPCTMLCQEAG